MNEVRFYYEHKTTVIVGRVKAFLKDEYEIQFLLSYMW